MLYIIEADETTKAAIQRAVRTIQNNPPEMTPIVQDEEGRTTPIHVVAEFYDNQLRTAFPQLMPWSQLDQETRTGIALIMTGYIPWQFPEHYQLDLDDTYADVTNTHPKTLRQEETDPPTPTPEPHNSNASNQITQEVREAYEHLMEATADSESLTPWTSLPDTEKARLTDVCQRALDRDHTADIIDILQENTAKTPPEIP